MRIGIDFGTTRSVVTWCDRGNYPVVSFQGETGDPMEWYPSVVAERAGELRFGFTALAMAQEPGWTLLRSFKRILSEPDATTDCQVQVGASRLPLRDLLQGFLEALRRDLVETSNLPAPAQPGEPFQAMVAVPAHAHSTQRFLTLDAFRRAGFQVLGVVNEPSAGAYEYSHRHRDTLTSRREHVLVYDLGGGTFDVSLIRMSGTRHEVVETAGIGRLGGDDFDGILAGLAVPGYEALPLESRNLLLERSRLAKEALNPSSKRIHLELDGILEDGDGTGALVSAADYFEACLPLVERTRRATEEVLLQARPAGDGAELAELAGLYVVGGASALPVVGRVLRNRFGRRVHRSPYPSAATAIGLAIAAEEHSRFVLADRLSRTFGVFREVQGGQQVAFDGILDAHAPLPAAGAPPFISTRRYQPAHNLGHLRFMECDRLDSEGNPCGDITWLAELHFPYDPALRAEGLDLSAVPVAQAEGALPTVEECYAVDDCGLVQWTIRDVESGYQWSGRFEPGQDRVRR